MLLPVIMAGGSGSRLWPFSRTHYPKQFLSLSGDISMLQQTVSRLDGIEHLPPCVICNEEHRFLVAEQLRQSQTSHSGIILEPVGRNTAPAIALAALKAMSEGNDPMLLVLAADHLIKDVGAFTRSVELAGAFAKNDKLVTFGIVPLSPETGYGYIRRGEVTTSDDASAYIVDAFVEKPDLATAQSYLATQAYYWNSGMFLFKASRYLDELAKLRPDILTVCKASLEAAKRDLEFTRVDKPVFLNCPDESIDYAVMENTSDAIVVPMDAGWSDVGSWSSLWEVSDKDADGNVLLGDVIADNSQNCYISAPERLVAAVGVEDLVIVDTKDALLVAHKDNVQDVKNVVSELKYCDRSEFLEHREIYRPWGKHDHVAEGSRYHVKKVTVKPGEKTAMQIHYHRAEHWIVVSGTARVHRGEGSQIVSEDESIYIRIGEQHAIENPGKIPLVIIEVRTGGYLEEDDVIRIGQIGEGY
ncbi:mannose-1-phosphate guanylyltransferase/mannose-6-phosphate isomerase [Vibrio sp. HA2012]|uniref:mannose-1-phosphate guanylyltransferase/mannose-6-phosphate isomerase n=1 Tax=Vibrio sp. HA2012 TaxID=1971595 RepID=UPI000C2BB549|nr:mannose-1-phosphate guanylyltransferase/mannose-6-phosphate isomerase [Vibrio sp. HA2012]PJC86320.1 mannose-1-phosphate guanylyltransferase/mannose-6-phosphate isomerase [Vibrio sp. HA2012]